MHLQLNYSLLLVSRGKRSTHLVFYINAASNIPSVIQFVKRKIPKENNLYVTNCLSLRYIEWHHFLRYIEWHHF